MSIMVGLRTPMPIAENNRLFHLPINKTVAFKINKHSYRCGGSTGFAPVSHLSDQDLHIALQFKAFFEHKTAKTIEARKP